MNESLKDRIPKQGFGLCRWCASESVRLAYLMCPKCTRIFNLVPSKTMVRMNNPEAKRRVQGLGGATVKNIAPEVREFILDSKSRFPPETSDQEHWAIMQDEAVDHLSQAAVRERISELHEKGITNASVEETEYAVAVEKILEFMIVVAILNGKLKFDIDPATEAAFEQVCEECLENVVNESSRNAAASMASKAEAPKAAAPRMGMNVSDLIKKRR